MFDVDKNIDPLNLTLTDNESTSIISQIENDSSIEIQPLISENVSLKIRLFEQILKAFSVSYLVFGVIVAVLYFLYETLSSDNSPIKNAWNWIGNINSFLTLFVFSMIVVSKILIHRNPNSIRRKKSGNQLLFYVILILSGIFSWFSLLSVFVKNIIHNETCVVFADIFLPITRLMFLMAAVILIFDIINCKIKQNEKTVFYFVYKSTSFLLFVTCINMTVFEIFHSMAINYQQILKKKLINSYPMLCNATYFDEFSDIMQSWFHVFSFIFSIVTVVVCIKPLEQFNENYNLLSNEIENQQLVLRNNHNSPLSIQLKSKFFPFILLLCILIFLLITFNVPICILSNKSNDKNLIATMKIVSNCLPFPTYLICGSIDLYLLKLLHENYRFQQKKNSRSTFIYMLWLSVFGMVLCLARNFINSLEKLNQNSDQLSIWGNIVGIVIDWENLFESILQAMMLDYLFRLNWNCSIRQTALKRMYNCCMILIACNLGNFITNYYNESGNNIFQPDIDDYYILIWNILSVLGVPLILLYRAFCPIILWEFCNQMNCNEN